MADYIDCEHYEDCEYRLGVMMCPNNCNQHRKAQETARIEKAVPRRKSYMYACSVCKGEFYFCGMNCNYNYCPRCGRPFERGKDDGKG